MLRIRQRVSVPVCVCIHELGRAHVVERVSGSRRQEWRCGTASVQEGKPGGCDQFVQPLWVSVCVCVPART